MECIPRKLDVKGFTCFHTLLHELLSPLSHAEDIDGIRIVELEGLFVTGIPIVFIITMFSRPTSTDMPLAIMRRGVASPPQQFANGCLRRRKALNEPRFD